jgi:hypothetical protein
MLEPTPDLSKRSFPAEPRRSALWLFVSPLSLILMTLHFCILLAWFSLFWAIDSEVGVFFWVLVIDPIAFAAQPYVVRLLDVMGALGTFQWSCAGAGLTALWRWLVVGLVLYPLSFGPAMGVMAWLLQARSINEGGQVPCLVFYYPLICAMEHSACAESLLLGYARIFMPKG